MAGRQAPVAQLGGSCRWLPHVARESPGLATAGWFRDDGTGAGALLTHLESLAEGTGGDQANWLVVAIDVTAAQPDQIGAITAAAQRAPCTVVWLAPTASQRPAGCTVAIEVAPRRAMRCGETTRPTTRGTWSGSSRSTSSGPM